MAFPVLNATLNKVEYEPGETAYLTVTYSDADNRTENHTTTITGTDQDGNNVTVSVNRYVNYYDKVSLSVSDTKDGLDWQLVSDDGAVAVYSAVV